MRKIVHEPVDHGKQYYQERTNRNIGWLLQNEQERIRKTTVGIAGNGGMGGLVSAVMLRAGFKEIRIADSEDFDLSNMNRQFACRQDTIGKSKAITTGDELRRITDDTRIVIYPDGITPATVNDFIAGCDIILDEIEFFAISARILLHQRARQAGVPILNCDTIGFRSFLFFFTPTGTTVEDLLGVSYKEACILENACRDGSLEAREEIIKRICRVFFPEIPEYKDGDRAYFMRRLREEGRVSILPTNPVFAGGFLSNRVLLHVIQQAGIVKRNIVETPEVPQYIFEDATRPFEGSLPFPWK